MTARKALVVANNVTQEMPAGDLLDEAGLADGGCQLVYTSATVCTLNPVDGGLLVIGSTPAIIPSGGVAYALSGLSANTRYYVYATLSGSTIGLAVSTTGWVLDAAGRKVLNQAGGAGYRLVGMFLTNGSGQLSIANNFISVLSYFHRQRVIGGLGISGGQTASTSYAALAALSVTLPLWPDEEVRADVCGYASSNVAGGTLFTTVGLDGSSPGGQCEAVSPNTNAPTPVAAKLTTTASEGGHTFVVDVAVSGGSTGTWYVTLTVATRG